jgi:putative addiction module component (TIGR02574 family)
MSNEAQQILREALKLPIAERADVASELLASLDEPEDEGVEEAWALEIERRARRVLAGESTGTDWVEVRARIGILRGQTTAPGATHRPQPR